MNFLIKIEEAINRFIETFLVKLKDVTPDFIFHFIGFIKSIPKLIKAKIQKTIPKVRVFFLKCIGYTEHYVTIVRGAFISLTMYLRSDEFKKANKFELLLKPVKYAKEFPFKALTFLFTVFLFISATTVIFKNTEKIINGAKALRGPASAEVAEEDIFILLKNHKFDVKLGAPGGHEGKGAEAHEYEVYLDVKIEANSPHDKEFLERMEEMLDDNLEALELPVTQLPIIPENQKKIEELMVKSLNADFMQIGHDNPIKSISLKQNLPSRPQYYRQAERMMTVEDINLQIFLEDTRRNRQVWLDFSVLATNRNVVLYLQDHEVELKDHLTTNVEPVIPQLPIEEEGKQIIKDKIKAELNQFLEKNGIEGKVQEIYINYLMAS